MKQLILFLSLMLFWCVGNALVLTAPPYLLAEYNNEWTTLEYSMTHTTDPIITIIWEGDGGSMNVLDQFLLAVHTAQINGHKVNINVIGEAVSAHAVATCYVNNTTMTVNAVLIFHSVFYRVYFNGHPYKIYNDSMSRSYLYTCISKGILTQQDVDVIVNEHKRLDVFPDGSKKVYPDYR